MQSDKLLQLLLTQTTQLINQVEPLKTCDLYTLTWKANEKSWNILECLEHLNLYGDFYLPQLERKIENADSPAEPEFKSGLLGSYFAKSMLPKEKMNKMKTFKDKNPLNNALDKTVIDKFVKQQTQLLALLNKARTVSLNKVKIPTSISVLIRLKLGDTFQFYINHMIRHVKQIDNIQIARKNA